MAIWLAGCQATRPPPEPAFLTPSQVRQDLHSLSQILSAAHVAPWLHLSRKEFLAQIGALEKGVFWPMRPSDVYRLVAPLVARLGDPHTRLLPPPIPPEARVFPLALSIERGRVLVTGDVASIPRVPVGAEVTGINGVATTEILSRLRQYVASETESGSRRRVQAVFPELLYHVMQMKPPFTVAWRLGYAKQTTKLPGVLFDAYVGAHRVRPDFSTFELGQNIYVLKIRTLDMPPEEFRAYCNALFQKIMRVPEAILVLDLRGNAGGLSENIMTLLHWLVPEARIHLPELEIRLSDAFKHWYQTAVSELKNQKYGKYLAWLPWQYLEGWRWRLLIAGTDERVQYDWALPATSQPTFEGSIAVITDGGCFSGCVLLTDTLVQLRSAPLIGELPGELAGRQRLLPITQKLPNSGLWLEFPVAQLADKNTHRRLTLKYPIEITGADLASGHDPAYVIVARLFNHNIVDRLFLQ